MAGVLEVLFLVVPVVLVVLAVAVDYEVPGLDSFAAADSDVADLAAQVFVHPAFVEAADPAGRLNSGTFSFFPLSQGFSN